MRVMHYAGAEAAGGLLAHVVLLVEGLAGAGHAVHVVLSPLAGADEAASSCAAAGASVTRLAVRGKADLSGMVRLRRLVARASPEIFHLHLSSPVEAIPALMAARWGGARRIVTTEHAPTWFPLERPYSRAAKRAAGRWVGAVVALCRNDARFLRERFGVRADRIAVIPNGVASFGPQPPRAEARARLGLPDGRLLVGFVGSLEAKKGVLDLIEAASRCEERGLAVSLAGEGSLGEELRGRASQLPFELILTGRLREVGTFLAALDIFALPSRQEAMPLALLEAMAAGLPIIAARVGGIPEAIEDGASGLLVDPGRPDQIAAALVRLARDPALRSKLGAAARGAAAARFGAARMVRSTEALYEGLLAGAEGTAA